MGNFSRDTFDRLKRYVSVRLQQGVPVVDSDWNEHEDIRKHELEDFLRWFVGDGVPMGNDGFAIASVADGNDFSIAAGCCLVNGWSVVNENALRYTEQADPPPLTVPASDRTDTVYLDVWEQEVSSEEDPNLVNPDIGIETCVRIKREWRVRVAENAASLPEPPAGHVFYPLATLNRKAGQDVSDSIIDLRRTGLTLAGAPLQIPFKYNTPNGGLRLYERAEDYWDIRNISHGMAFDYLGTTKLVLQYSGNVGIGTASPRTALEISSVGPYGSLWVGSGVNHPGWIYYGNSATDWKVGKFETGSDNFEIRDHHNNTHLAVTPSSNVGIGTTSPAQKLEIDGGNIVIDRHGPNDDSLYIGTAGGNGQIVPGSTGGAQVEFQNIKEGSGSSQAIHFLTHHNGVSHARRMTIDKDGKVGIGTTSPAAKLDIRGSSDQNAFHVDDGQEDLRILSSNNRGLDGGVITIGGSWGPTGYIKTTAQNLTAGDLVIGNRRSRDATRMEPGIVLRYDGNVGIGTTSPAKKLHIQGIGSGPLCNDGNDRPGLAITGSHPQLDLFSSGGNVYHGPTIRLGSYTDGTLSSFKQWVIGTAGWNAHFLDFGFSDINDPNPHCGIRGYNGKTVMTLAENGNVGIGTITPQATLDVTARTFRLGTALHWDGITPTGGSMISSDGVHTDLIPGVDDVGYVRVRDGNSPGGIIFANFGSSVISSFSDLQASVPSTLQLQGHGGPVALPPGDYAEYFESSSGKEIPAGTSVVLVNDKIRPAKKSETPIGVISANPGIVGSAHMQWPKKYLRDELGNMIMERHREEAMAPKKEKVTRERQKVKRKTVEEQATRTEIVLKGRKYVQKEITETVTRVVDEPVFEEVDLYDATGKTVIGKHRVPVMETYEEEIIVLDDEGRQVLVGTGKFETNERPKLNPDYDETKEYVPREKRPEWNCVGLLGKLPVRKGQPVAESWIKMKDISDEVELWLVK